jgi:hypothetical protein
LMRKDGGDNLSACGGPRIPRVFIPSLLEDHLRAWAVQACLIILGRR